nr:glycosyltransferase family A protein [Halomicroarcula sp. DFY41]
MIPTYNRPKKLERAIESVEKQTYNNIQLIVVNDYPEDKLKRSNLPPFVDKIINHNSNQGASAARNCGIKHAGGEYIAFLDDDDEWCEQKLEKQIKTAISTECLAIYCGYKTKRESGKLESSKQKQEVQVRDLLAYNCIGTTSVALIKAEVFEDVGNFDTELPSCQDWDLWIRVATEYKWKCINEPLVIYHAENSNRISENQSDVLIGHRMLMIKHSELLVDTDRTTKSRHYYTVGKKYYLAEEQCTASKLFFKSIRFFPPILIKTVLFVLNQERKKNNR